MEETIDDEYTVDEEPVLMAEGATTTGVYVLQDSDINLFSITNKKDASGFIENNGTLEFPPDKYLMIKVGFQGISKKVLRENYSKTVVYNLPNFFRTKDIAPKDVFEESTNKKLFTLEIKGGKAIIVYEDDFISGDDNVASFFFVEGEINLQELKNDGTSNVQFAGNGTNVDIKLDYGADYLEKYGEVSIKKIASKVDMTNNCIKYEITATAGVDGCGSVYVVDKFSLNADKVLYKEITKEEIELPATEDGVKPFETRNDTVIAGKIYLTNVKDDEKIPSALVSGETLNEPNTFVWTIGNMGANEVRKLTYYVELKDTVLLNRNGIDLKNIAYSYAKKDTTIYDKSSSENIFNANVKYDGYSMKKETVSNDGKKYVKNNDGTYTVKYRLNFTLYKDSTFPLRGFEFWDDFNYSDNKTDDKALEYIEYKTDSINVYKRVSGSTTDEKLDTNTYQTLWSVNNGEYKSNVEELSGKPTRFKVTGTTENPITINPGDYYFLEYSVIVKPEAFAAMSASSFKMKNRFLFDASNASKASYGAVDRVYNNLTINSYYAWNNKSVSGRVATPIDVDVDGDKYDLTSGAIQSNSETITSFNVPEGSYKYNVLLNQTMGEWDVTSATVSDTINPIGHLKYVGYMKVERCEYDAATKKYNVIETKWIKINDRSNFSFRLSDIGWSNNNCSYNLEYYAVPYNLNGISNITITNTFNLEKATRNGAEFVFNNLNSSQNIQVEGLLSLSATKEAWRYEDPKAEDKGRAWANGKIYWIIKLSGNKITAGTIIKDATTCRETPDNKTDFVDNYIREDSIEGIYKGNFANIEEFKNQYNGLTNIEGLFDVVLEGTNSWYLDNAYRDLILKAKQDIDLTNEDLYIVVKTEPEKLPDNPSYYRHPSKYLNRVYREGTDGKQEELAYAETYIYYGGDILKEFGQTFKYENDVVTTIDKKADSINPSSVIAKDLLSETGPGLYASWAFKVNYAGDLSGDYRVIENIPEGMDLAYVRIKWHGEFAGTVNSMDIEGLDANWVKKTNDAINDDRGKPSQNTIYYVNNNTRQAMIKLGSFTYKKVEDKNSVDIQVVCKVTDSKVLMGGEDKSFKNTVELLIGDGQKLPADRRDPSTAVSNAPFNHDNTSGFNKIGVKDASNGRLIKYTIEANVYGQELEPNSADKKGLVLVDELDKNLELDVSTIEAKDSNGSAVEFKYDFDDVNNVLKVKIPNKKKVIITYAAIAKIQPTVTANITNKVHWDGYSQNGGKVNTISNYSYTVGAGGGGSSNLVLSILKYDKDDNTIKLKDVEFKAWECKLESGVLSRVDELPEATVTTDVNGKATISSGLEYKKIYEVKETKTPDGYVDENKTYYVACVDTNYADFVNQCNNYNQDASNKDKIAISYGSSSFKLQVLNSQKGILVQKNFKNAGGNPTSRPISGEYRFGLYSNADGSGEPIEIVNIRYDTSVTGILTARFKNPMVSGPYYVFELDDDNKPIVDTSKSQVINGMEYLTTYSNGTTNDNSASIGDTVTVTNQVYTRQLPATGGNGINGYIKSGAILMLLTGVMLLRRR